MIFRTDDRYAQNTFCDAGPNEGTYRAIGFVYGTYGEIAALLGARKAELIVVEPAERSSDLTVPYIAPDWWPYGKQFPDWQVWRGVAGLLYARRPKSSPPKVVRAATVEGLRDQIEITISLGD